MVLDPFLYEKKVNHLSSIITDLDEVTWSWIDDRHVTTLDENSFL